MRVVKTRTGRTHQTHVKHGAKAYLLVYVRNCGWTTSYAATVRAWVGEVAPNGDIPPWKSASWQQLVQVSAPVPATVAPDAAAGADRIWVFEWTPASAGKNFALLAEATSADDPSNIDPLTQLPCATVTAGGAQSSQMPYLVSCDNNLGLVVVGT